jgi:ATP-dependent helicase HrpB
VIQEHSAAPLRLSNRLAPTGLPVEEAIAPLRDAFHSHRHAVLVAPPGAGKTTLVPLRLIDEPWIAGRRIIMLEPRRLAARAAAQRMAHMLGEKPGDTVGYQTRDERRIGPDTRIEVLTEGILTRRLQNDPTLEGTALVIFDEVHERNLPTDLGLAFLLDAIETFESDVRILAMSATAQAELFAGVLADEQGDAPVVTSMGRTFPVDVRYVPRQRDDRLENAVAETVLTSLRDDEGDMLVFLPGIGEINRAQTVLRERVPAHVDVLRLAGALPFAEQDAALNGSADGRRRVVLSTDIAETSLTVEGVHIVVDAGLARTPRLDARTGLTELVTVTSSRASAEQRSGRAGRVKEGVAYRLWSRIEDSTRLAHLPAEITQADLCGPALEIAAWGTPLSELTFLDTPPERNMKLATDTLTMLHLLDENGAITALGRQVLGLPLHPRLGTMVARNRDFAPQGWVACVVAALIEERDIMRGRPDSLPTDLAVRVKAVMDIERHDLVDRGALHRVRDAARDIARRSSIDTNTHISSDMVDTLCGAVLLSAYPDRFAMRRSSAGQFVMRGGGGVNMDAKDSIAREQFIVAADIDAQRNVSRVRRAAAVDLELIAPVLGDDVEVESYLMWDKGRDDLVQRVVRKVGSIRIDERDLTPVAGDETTEALLERVKSTSMAVLGGGAATQFRQRISFLRHHIGEEWPDTSNARLMATMNEWLLPYLAGATGKADLAGVDLTMVLQSNLGWDKSSTMESLAPAKYEPPRGRPVDINYADPASPTIAIRVQHLFGVTTHPSVLNGAVPLRIQLLSPADRPIQITADLPNFWTGSWTDVRKDMAGRYPKHDWPIDPSA